MNVISCTHGPLQGEEHLSVAECVLGGVLSCSNRRQCNSVTMNIFAYHFSIPGKPGVLSAKMIKHILLLVEKTEQTSSPLLVGIE